MYNIKNDEVERILYCKCSVLCYIFKYSYIVQKAKKHTRHVFALNMQNTIKHSTWQCPPDYSTFFIKHVKSDLDDRDFGR